MNVPNPHAMLDVIVDLVADMIALRMRPREIKARLTELQGKEPSNQAVTALCAKARAVLLQRLGVERTDAQSDAVGLYEQVLRSETATWADKMRAQAELSAIYGLSRTPLVLNVQERPVFDGPQSSELGTLDWARRFLPHLFLLPPSRMHVWLGEELDALRRLRGQWLVEIGPRGSAKSTIASTAGTLNDICEKREPYIILISDTATQAQGILDGIKDELESNEALARAYPGACGRGPTWRDDKIVTRNGVVVEALGTGCKLRGRRVGAFRPTKIVIDDGENDDHITSPSRCAKTRSWFDRAVMKAGGPETNIIVVGSSLATECLVENLARRPGWRSKRWPSILCWPDRMDLWAQWETILNKTPGEEGLEQALAFYTEHQEEMDAGADVLWPEREPLYDLMLQRAVGGARSFEAEKQSKPVAPENTEWPEDYLNDETWVETWPADPVWRVLALDPSKGGDSKRGDYQARVRLEVDAAGIVYIGAHMAREDVEVMCEGLVDEAARIKPNVVVLEVNAWQDLLAAPIMDAAERFGCHVPLAGVNNSVKKKIRIRRWTSWLAQRKVRFVAEGGPGTRLLAQQFRDFPGGDHDDGPDAAEVALRAALSLESGDQGDLEYFR